MKLAAGLSMIAVVTANLFGASELSQILTGVSTFCAGLALGLSIHVGQHVAGEEAHDY